MSAPTPLSLLIAAPDLPPGPRGAGARAPRRHLHRPLHLTSLFDDLAGGELVPQTTVLVRELIEAPAAVAARLAIPPAVRVLHLRRLRTADGEPLAILENWVPSSCADLGAAADLESTGLYRAMREAGVRMRVADQRIGARIGNDEECRLLGEPPDSPMMTMQRLTHDDSGRAVEWGDHVYRASRYEFTMTLVGR